VSLKSKPLNQREAFVNMNKGKTITLTGTVKGAGSGGFGGSMVLFSPETEDAPNQEPGGVDISVALDDHPFAACEYDLEKQGKATCKRSDGSGETIASGQKLTVTGNVLYCRGDWFDRSLLMIGSAVIDERYGTPGS
jgi:hypothetical protein